jgi:hypothetical protein
MSVLTPRMNDRSAIPAGIWREPRRLIDCWTLKAAKKIRPDPAYSILFGHLHFRIEGFCKHDEDCTGSGERRTSRQQVIFPIQIEDAPEKTGSALTFSEAALGQRPDPKTQHEISTAARPSREQPQARPFNLHRWNRLAR